MIRSLFVVLCLLWVPLPADAHKLDGWAAWYGRGHKTASGSPFQPEGLTAAHLTLPFGTRVKVTDLATGRSVVVVITDRGPLGAGKIIDLSLGAARALGIVKRGVALVHVEVL